MEALVFGGSGMLGVDLLSELRSRGFEVTAPRSSETDITDPGAVATLFSELGGSPKMCFNCAAYTAVDLAESERDRGYALNALAAGYVAQMCAMVNMRMIHVSTDFVFDGESTMPYSEDAPTHPLGVYGASKLEGERSVLAATGTVVRTSWLYGVHGKSFPRTILNAYRAGKTLRVVSDQIGCPTYTPDLARTLVDLASQPLGPPPGVFHACGPDAMSWFELAQLVVEAAGGQADEVQPCRTEDWPTPAKRPKYSVLDQSRLRALGVAPIRSTAEAIREFVAAISA